MIRAARLPERVGYADPVTEPDDPRTLSILLDGTKDPAQRVESLLPLVYEQLRAVADTGGTVGVIYQSSYLGPKGEGGRADLLGADVAKGVVAGRVVAAGGSRRCAAGDLSVGGLASLGTVVIVSAWIIIAVE